MSSMLRITEAASLALHAIVVLTQNPSRPLPAGEIAVSLGVSEAHLAKVLQRLTKTGFVKSTRGPRGGYVTARAADQTTLLEVYEAIEGPLVAATCLLDKPVCGGHCILGELLAALDKEAKDYLTRTKLSELASVPIPLAGNRKELPTGAGRQPTLHRGGNEIG